MVSCLSRVKLMIVTRNYVERAFIIDMLLARYMPLSSILTPGSTCSYLCENDEKKVDTYFYNNVFI